MNLARVFPRKTKQSPDDDRAFFGMPDIKTTPYFDAVDVSVAFTWDIPKAEAMAERWRHHTASVRLGGPAYKTPSGEFISGKYVKKGITFTSRGCPNKCWFCSVWKREPKLKELVIQPGHIIQDDNLLACSDEHVRKVFEMLKDQPDPARFSGGLEAKILKEWHVEEMSKLRVDYAYFAYDTKDDLDPLIQAGRVLDRYGFSFESKKMRCFVLCGFPEDTISAAQTRIEQVIAAGLWTFAMLWRNEKGKVDRTWSKFQRHWVLPALYFREANQMRINKFMGDL